MIEGGEQTVSPPHHATHPIPTRLCVVVCSFDLDAVVETYDVCFPLPEVVGLPLQVSLVAEVTFARNGEAFPAHHQ